MEAKLVYRYSEAFKIDVVKELESGKFDNINQARCHYGINGSATITNWLKKYGRRNLCPKVVRVEKPNEKDRIRQLKEEIKELKMALGETQAKRVLGNSYLHLACKELGTDVESFKKKAGLQQFIMQKKTQKKQ